MALRIALISDIHGNTIALDAVLADAHARGVERHWFLGDFSAIGPEPAAVLERIASLPDALFVRGNTDRYVVTGEGPPPRLEQVREDPGLILPFARIKASFAWTRGFLTATGWLDWLAALPLDARYAAPSGHHILLVHASPGTDDGEGVHPGRSTAELSTLLAGEDADVILVGHTHEVMVRSVDGRLLVNAGCVSNPRPPDLRASYAILELTGSGIKLELRRVEYDREAFAASVRRSRHPAAEFILSHQSGDRPGRDPHPDQTPIAEGTVVTLAARQRA